KAVRPAQTTPTSQSHGEPCSLENACHKISSLEKKPARPGTPAIARTEIVNVQKVHGMYFLSPPILRMSCSPPIAWMTLPEPKKRHALKKACVMRWKTPAA